MFKKNSFDLFATTNEILMFMKSFLKSPQDVIKLSKLFQYVREPKF
jgi:hypothetical protein